MPFKNTAQFVLLTMLIFTGSSRVMAQDVAPANEEAVVEAVEIAEANTVQTVDAFDWSQVLGPTRNGVIGRGGFAESWPDQGPQLVWNQAVGTGNAGPVIANGKVIVFHRTRDSLVCDALNPENGESVWRSPIDVPAPDGGLDGDNGPKATPLVADGKVFLFDLTGWLICLDLEDGAEIWKVDLRSRYKAPGGYFGSGSSPLMVDGKLIVNVGGSNACVVAIDPEDGQEIWAAVEDRASYSSPTTAEYRGSTIVIVNSRTKILGLDPGDGAVQFEIEFGRGGATAKGATPVVVDGHLFVNAAYGFGAKWIDLTTEPPAVVWENDNSFSSHYTTPVFLDGFLYGTAGREDFNNGSLRCVEAESGDIKWSESTGVGHVLLAGGKILLVEIDGTTSLLEASPEGLKKISSFAAFDGERTRAIPGFSNGRLFVRSIARGGAGSLKCFQVGESE